MTTDTLAQPPIIIVGGGLSGLCSAAILARAGHAVTLFEKAGDPGGRAITRQHSTFSFNQGAHAFYLGGMSEKLLSELGVHYSGSVPTSNTFLALEDKKLHSLPTNVLSLFATTLLSPSAKGALARFYNTLKHTKHADLQGISLQDWLERQVQHPQVRQLILAIARLATYTNAPDLLSAGLVVPLLTAQVRYLDGGWQTLVDGLCQAAQQAGAKIVTRARVATIEVAGEKHAVRLADGRRYEAAAILLATNPGMASSLVANGTHEALSRWATQSIPARAACFDIALRRLPDQRRLFALGIDRPLYYSVHSIWANLAPQGSALIHTMKYLQPGEPVDSEAIRKELESMLDLLQPGWRAEAVEQFFLPHMTASNAIVLATQGGLPGRSGPTVPGIRNLYVAGDWVGTEGQLAEACFASARKAASMIMTTLATERNNYAAAHQGKS